MRIIQSIIILNKQITFGASQKFWSNGSNSQPLSIKLLFILCLLKIAESAENLRSNVANTNSSSNCDPCPIDCCPDDTTCTTSSHLDPDTGVITSYVCDDGSDSDLKYLALLVIPAIPLLFGCYMGTRKCITATREYCEKSDLRRNLMG